MYTSFINLSDIDNRRRKTIVQENTIESNISFNDVNKSLRENNINDFKSKFKSLIDESLFDSNFINNNIDKYIKVLEDAKSKFENVDNEIICFENIIPYCNNLNYLYNRIVESSIYNPNMVDIIKKNKISSRIISNNNYITKNMELPLLTEYSEDFVIEFCERFDETFNMPTPKKFIVCIEGLSYILDKNYIKYNPTDMINTITDYFILSKEEENNVNEDINIMEDFLNTLINETNCVETEGLYLLEKTEDEKKEDDISKLIDGFKKDTNKSYNKLKLIVTKLYAKDPTHVLKETPHILSLLRYLAVFGSFSVPGYGMILGVLTFMTDQFIKMGVRRSHSERMYNYFNKEYEKANKQVEKYSDDKESTKYKNAKAYADTLYDCTNKIGEFNKSLYSDKELEDNEYEKDNKFTPDKHDLDDDDFGFDTSDFDSDFTDDFDFNIDESAGVNKVLTKDEFINNHIKDLLNKIKINESIFVDKLTKISNDDSIEINIKGLNLCDVINNLHRYITRNHEFMISRISVKYSNPDVIDDIRIICNEMNSNTDDIKLYHLAPCNNTIIVCMKYCYRLIFDTNDEDIFYSDYNVVNTDLDKMAYIQTMESYIDKFIEIDAFNMNNIIRENIENIANSDLVDVSNVIIGMGDIINKESYINKINELKNKNKDTMLEVNINMSLGVLKDIEDYSLSMEDNLDIELEAASIMYDIINEKVDLASLKLASMNLMNKAKAMGNKEKEISKNFDISMNRVKTNIEKALTTNKRESIIKGSIIPSASKCLKTALLFGGTALVNPALAVIGAIGALAISKNLSKKEREMLLQEIEIELKYVEKEISDAESKGNNKKYKQLLIYQNKLLKEQSRIRHNMKVSPYDPRYGASKGLGERS